MMQLVSQTQQQIISTSTASSSHPTLDGEANDPGKMFVGGLSWSTTEERMKEYFSQFGEVLECCIMQDPMSKRSRGFGFIKFADSDAVDRVVDSNHPHMIDGKKVDPKRAVPKNQSKVVSKTKKVFLGGLPPDTHEDDIRAYFGQYGEIEEVMLMYDKNTQRLRGFGFVKFTKEESADDACREHYHEIKGKMCEAKKAQPKEVMSQIAAQKPNSNTGLMDSFPGLLYRTQSLLSYNPAALSPYPNALLGNLQNFGALNQALNATSFYPMLMPNYSPSPAASINSIPSMSPPSKKALQSPVNSTPANNLLYPTDAAARAITPAAITSQKLTELAMIAASHQATMATQTSAVAIQPPAKHLAQTPPIGSFPATNGGGLLEMYQNEILIGQLAANQGLQAAAAAAPGSNLFTDTSSLLAAFNGYQ